MTPPPASRRWIGRSIIAIGALHFIVAFLIYADAWREIAADGFMAAVDDFSSRATAYWFWVAAPLMMMLGGMIDNLEARALPVPVWLRWALTATLVAMLLMMPVNGGWLLVIPLIGLFVRGRR